MIFFTKTNVNVFYIFLKINKACLIYIQILKNLIAFDEIP